MAGEQRDLVLRKAGKPVQLERRIALAARVVILPVGRRLAIGQVLFDQRLVR